MAITWKINQDELRKSPQSLDMYQKVFEKGLWFTPAGALAESITNSDLGMVYVCGGVILSLVSLAGLIRLSRIYDRRPEATNRPTSAGRRGPRIAGRQEPRSH